MGDRLHRQANNPARDDDPRVQALAAAAEATFAPASERESRVPYERITDALVKAARAFPHAVSLRPVWTPSGEHEVLVMVWEKAANGHLSAHTVAVNA